MAEKVYNKQVQRTIFDLDSFEEVTLVKTIEFEPVASVQDALVALGNDSAKLLEVINDGLLAEKRRIAGGEAGDWHTFTDEGEVNGPFTGTPANMKAVNALTLTLAKTVYGFNGDMTKDQKRTAKESARAMIASTPAIREGLKKTAALTSEE